MDRYQKIRDALALGPSGGAWQWGGSVCRDNETALAICKEHFDATPLPNENGYFCEVWAEDAKRVALVGHGRNGQNNAQYIAACDPSTIQALLDERDELLDALRITWKVIDAAGLGNLVNGVQLGPVSWLIKAEDAKAESLAAIAKATGGAQ